MSNKSEALRRVELITDAELGHLVVSLAQIHNAMKQKIINRGSNDYPVFDNSEE